MVNRSDMSNLSHSGAAQPNIHDEQPAPWVDQPLRTPRAPLPRVSSSRVCDRCMLRKVKCNLQRPACSRCIEEDRPCVYSSTKRRPGPAKGSRGKRSTAAAVRSTAESEIVPTTSNCNFLNDAPLAFTSVESLLSQQVFPQPESLPAPFPAVTANSVRSVETSSSLVQPSHPQSPIDPHLQPGQEHQLLEDFFTHIHPSMPLFRRKSFLGRYEHGLVSRDLLLTIFAVCAKVLGVNSVWSSPSLDICLEYLLTTNVAEKETPSGMVSLGDFQQACLLAFYEFHQYPGLKAWLRIGQLTRRAYHWGLHQIDNQDHCPLKICNPMTEEEAEEWRHVWWCIYCLDSYCNITAATPFVVEVDSVKTALVRITQLPDTLSDKAPPIFLPAETELLWETIKEITCRGGDFNFNIHIVTTTILREAATLSRLWKQNPSERLRRRFATLGDHLCAIRLALPRHYLNVARNVLINESASEHHARLVCILHLHASRALISLPRCLQENETEWRHQWQESLEYCEDIVSVVRHWNAQFCSSVDPAICLIISSALTLIHLNGMDEANSSTELKTRLERHRDLLLLFLEQFASIWYLPRFLIMSFSKLTELLPAPLTSTEIDRILRLIEGPLHQSWFKFLSLAPDLLKPPIVRNSDPDFFSEWYFNIWDSWANVSSSSGMPQDF